MLVVYSFDEIEHHMDELLQAGYGFSVLGPHIDDNGFLAWNCLARSIAPSSAHCLPRGRGRAGR
jgi:hypothetical protein